ncbi:MAG: class I SAM-dependent methyltransferase [Rhodanobacteraceae bacterium]
MLIESPQIPMLHAESNLSRDPVLAALAGRIAAECSSWLARTAGTHALLLDAIGAAAPMAAGLGRWTALNLSMRHDFEGPLRADPAALPFCDNSFGAVLIRHLAGAGVPPRALAGEASRVLAPHGVLLVVECHPLSAWRPWWAARRKRGEVSLRAVAPRRWRSALNQAGLTVGEPLRCGAAWPSTRTMPRWLEHACGDAWLLSARKRDDGLVMQRMQHRLTRGVSERAPSMPGAHRLRS